MKTAGTKTGTRVIKVRGVVRGEPDFNKLALTLIDLAQQQLGIDDPELLDEFRRTIPKP